MASDKLFRRAWSIVWTNKWLLGLGFLMYWGGRNVDLSSLIPLVWRPLPFVDALDAQQPTNSTTSPIYAAMLCAISMWVVFVWVGVAIARGAAIVSVDRLDCNGKINFKTAWQAAWQRNIQLIGIELPSIVPVVVGIVNMSKSELGWTLLSLMSGSSRLSVIVLPIYVLVMLVIGLLQIFARRACMLQGYGVFASYAHGWQVLRAHTGSALMLYAWQIIIQSLLAMITVVGLTVLYHSQLSFLLNPARLVLGAILMAVFSGLWTLAWRRWTGRDVPDEALPAAA